MYSMNIIEYLNLKTNSHYKTTTRKTRDLIKARFNEKFTLEDFKNGLLKLKQIIENKNIKSIAITNIVQLDNVIDFSAIYDEIFYDCEFNVEVYNYKMICDTSPKELVQDNQKPKKQKNSLVTHITYPENTVFHI